MKIKVFYNWFFLFFVVLLFGQNNEKIASPFIFFKEKQANKTSNYSTPALYSDIETERFNTITGRIEKGYNCIIYTQHPEQLKAKGLPIEVTLPTFSTAWLTLEQIAIASDMPEVKYIDVPNFLKPSNDISVAGTGASLLHNGSLNNTAYKGDGVIVAIIDSGIDWDHLDFRNPTNPLKSRILRIWDQTLVPQASENSPAGYSLGVEYTKEQIEDEIDGTPAGFVREKDTDGHGTHVAGTAVGNGASLNSKYTGLAPNADIVVIKAGNGSFSTSNIISSLDYLKRLASSLGKPIVVNMSLGSQGGAHDGTDPLEVAIDQFTDTAAGHIVVVASGNDNGDNIHKQSILAPTAQSTIEIQVPTASASTKQDVFRHTMYANDASTMTAVVTAPDGTQATSVTGTGSIIMNGNARVYISNSIDSGSGDRRIQVYVTRTGTSLDVSGTWSIGLTNTSLNTITVDGWLSDKGDDYESTTLLGGDSNYLVTMPGCANKAITVGSFMGKIDWYSSSGSGYNYNNGMQDDISSFSGIGPRRDNVQKPDITANGQAVVSCLSSDSTLSNTSPYMIEKGLYSAQQGTSMATPAVAGCVALLLQMKPTATFDQIKTAITTTATKDSFTSNTSNNIWGHGKIDVFKAASSFTRCEPLPRVIYNYEQPYSSADNFSFEFSGQRAALKFTTTISGNLGGVFLKTVRNQTLTSLTVEVRSNNAGSPGTLLGTQNVTPSSLAKNTWNYIDLSNLSISVASGTDYFLIVQPGLTDTFGLGQERTNSQRSFVSNDGINWSSVTNLRIRPEVYAIQGSGTVVNNVTINLAPATGTNSQSLCKDVSITPISYTTSGSTEITFSGLPPGVSGVWSNNRATITGSSSQIGTYNYIVKATSGCNSINATGKIIIVGKPTITNVQVVKEQSATAVTVNGNYLIGESASTVTIGGVAATIRSATNSAVVFLLPQNSTGGNIIITNSCNESSTPFPYPYVAPTNINLSSTSVISNNTIGLTIASLSGTDTDQNDSFTYSLVNGQGGEDNANFSIQNNLLKAAVVFNAQVKSNHNIRIRITDAGGLYFEKTVLIKVVPDQDSDGVPDNTDQCPNTIAGAKVDFNGCEIFILPSNNYAVQATATSCVGQQNGAISVSATNTTYTYTVTINGQNAIQLNTANNFKNQFQNLAIGTYEICITIQGKPNYVQCYTIKVKEPNVLSVTNKMSTTGKQVTYSLSGANSYTITFNGFTQNYTSNAITFDLVSGQNTIAISTDLYCQGQFEDLIFVSEKVVVYPNPVQDVLNLYCSGTDSKVTAILTDLSGKRVANFSKTVPETRMIQFDLNDLTSGFYLLHLKGTSLEETIKIIKK